MTDVELRERERLPVEEAGEGGVSEMWKIMASWLDGGKSRKSTGLDGMPDARTRSRV